MNTAKLYDDLKTPLGEQAAKVLSESFESVNQNLASKASKEDFSELKKVVLELGESQKQLEQRMDKLEQRMDELEQRMDELEQRMDELTLRVDRLEESHNQLIKRVDKLTERVDELTESHKQLARQVGGLSASVGYGIEDQLYPYIPEFVKKMYGIQITAYELRKNIIYEKGKFDEINIYLEGILNNEKIFLLGECKTGASKSEIDSFAKIIERFVNLKNTKVIPFFVAYHYSPDIEEYFETDYPNMKYYKTYQIRSINMGFEFYN